MLQSQLKQLDQRKIILERQIDQLQQRLEYLAETKSLSCLLELDKQLIDQEGFPRPDLDFGELQNYRNLKRKLACQLQQLEMKNDHLALMKNIQTNLQSYHSHLAQDPNLEKQIQQYDAKLRQNRKHKQQKIEQQKQTIPTDIIKQQNINDKLQSPFAQIKQIISNGASIIAGWQVGDKLIKFGWVDIYCHDNLKNVIKVVNQNRNSEIQCVIQRNGIRMQSVIRPDMHGLGCRMIII